MRIEIIANDKETHKSKGRQKEEKQSPLYEEDDSVLDDAVFQ